MPVSIQRDIYSDTELSLYTCSLSLGKRCEWKAKGTLDILEVNYTPACNSISRNWAKISDLQDQKCEVSVLIPTSTPIRRSPLSDMVTPLKMVLLYMPIYILIKVANQLCKIISKASAEGFEHPLFTLCFSFSGQSSVLAILSIRELKHM